MADSVYRVHVWFSGRVQGVGFRYTTTQLARGYDVTGQVRNLNDGRVHLHVEGEEAEVRAFVLAIQEQMSGFIKDTEESVETPEGAREYSDFKIG